MEDSEKTQNRPGRSTNSFVSCRNPPPGNIEWSLHAEECAWTYLLSIALSLVMRIAKPAPNYAGGIDPKHGQPLRRVSTPQAHFPENVWKMGLKLARVCAVKNTTDHTYSSQLGISYAPRRAIIRVVIL